MARLPSGNWLIQQTDGKVSLFGEWENEGCILSFDPTDADATAKAQREIYNLVELTDEDKCFAHFWSGYFHAHATGGTRG
jgi:hypothetical protein